MTASARRRSSLRPDLALFVDAGFVLALLAVAVVAAWPIYLTPYMFVTAGGAVALGAGIALLSRVQRWSWLTTAGAVLAAYLVLGVPLAIPRALGSRADIVAGYRELLAATFDSWRKLVTVEAPVGHFQALLVPLFITLLVCSTAAFALVFHRVRQYGALIPATLAPVVFAIAFGTRNPGRPLVVGPVTIPAPLHALIGVLAFGLAGAFLVWRAQHARTTALAAVARASGVRRAGGTVAGTVRRVVGSIVVALVGLAVAVPVSSTVLEPSERHVLSDAVNPTPVLHQYVSPLIGYRKAFEPSAYNATLFDYSGDARAVGRLRVATMSFYDGQQFTVLSSDSDSANAFTHIPSITGRATQSKGLAHLDVTVRDLNRLGTPAVWLPTAAELRAISFDGSSANALTDGFYFNEQLQSGAELGRLGAGDAYSMLVGSASTTPALASIQPPAGVVPDTKSMPDSLTQWVQDQNAGSGGAALEKLISTLRARGFLSHSLVDPGLGTESDPTWLAAMPASARSGSGDAFQSSRAGESLTRIGDMFTDLTQVKKHAPADSTDAQLVGAVGDDEQFAVASALIAESLGFPARVVLGFALDPSVTAGSPIPACTEGRCTGANLTAWVEVQTADNTWVPIVTTPQNEHNIASTSTSDSRHELPTEVQPRGATVQPPPEANPVGGNNEQSQRDDKAHGAASSWQPAVRLAAQILTVLFVLAAPFLAVVIVKLARRRERRRAQGAAARMASGWDDLVDAAVDLGLPGPGVRSRTETATLYAAAARTADPVVMRTLASGADEAVFGAFDPTHDEAEKYWAHLDEQRARLAAGFPRWKRLRALISLRSFRTRGGGSA